MRFAIYLRNAAHNNEESAKLREATRLCILGWCLSELGHFVTLISPPDVLRNCEHRWKWFCDYEGADRSADVAIIPCDLVPPPDHEAASNKAGRVVGFKTTINISLDVHRLDWCDALMTHEYSPEIDSSEKLLPVPFLVYDKIIDLFARNGMLEPYMRGETQFARDAYRSNNPSRNVGFMGTGNHGRREIAETLPPWCECRFVEPDEQIGAEDYLRWLGDCKAGLHFSGDTPKATRFSELVLLGVPVITIPVSPRCVPPITKANTILLQDWAGHDGITAGLSSSRARVEHADECYRQGWSPMGQAKQLVAHLAGRFDELQN